MAQKGPFYGLFIYLYLYTLVSFDRGSCELAVYFIFFVVFPTRVGERGFCPRLPGAARTHIMITGIIGVPGCGKSTYLSMLAQQELKKISRGKSPYKRVYSNFACRGCYRIDARDLGRYDLRDCLILLDELTIDCDARDYKAFARSTKEFFILHRHFNIRIVYATQDPSRVDKTIRNLTYDLWYLKTSLFPLLRRWSICTRIYRNLNINEYTSELTLGYRFPVLRELLFSRSRRLCYRPRYYAAFDSFDPCSLISLPPYDNTLW